MRIISAHSEGIITQAQKPWEAMPCADAGYGFATVTKPNRNYFVGESSPRL